MEAPSPPEGCRTNKSGAPGLRFFGVYSTKKRSRPPTMPTSRVAVPVPCAAASVANSRATAAPVKQRCVTVRAKVPDFVMASAAVGVAGRLHHCKPAEDSAKIGAHRPPRPKASSAILEVRHAFLAKCRYPFYKISG